jgi:DNA mismatch repair protein MutL
MALTMARSSALVVGEVLSAEEMRALVEELFECEVPSYTPDGKKVFVIVEDEYIDEMFSK